MRSASGAQVLREQDVVPPRLTKTEGWFARHQGAGGAL